jgi:hypothetical protein
MNYYLRNAEVRAIKKTKFYVWVELETNLSWLGISITVFIHDVRMELRYDPPCLCAHTLAHTYPTLFSKRKVVYE